MPPDLNSLPPSRSPSNPSSPLLTNLRRSSNSQATAIDNNPPSPRSPTLSSLHATAAINAGLQRNPSQTRPSMSQERRRSSLITNLNLQDTTSGPPLDGIGAISPQVLSSSQPRSPLMNTADPHHQRTPSLGQIHQQLENEQEAQVNRLLSMIRIQQDQLASLQGEQTTSNGAEASSAIATDGPATIPSPAAESTRRTVRNTSDSRSPSMGAVHPSTRSPLQRPTTMSRQSSRGMQATSSLTGSPSLRPLSTTRSQDEWSMGGVRDENSFYQAETQMLQRENQMLKMRIRELERQVTELNKPAYEGGSSVGAAAPS